MPTAPSKPCRHYGCGKYQVKHGFCLDHQGDYVPRWKRDNRPSAAERGYNHQWQKFRAYYLRRHPICNRCNKPASVLHHIVEIDNGGSWYDESNLESLCRYHHEKEHGRKV